MSKLADVNTTDILDAIGLGCRCMSSVFNADDNNVPYFNSSVWPAAALGFSMHHTEAHVPGRHLNALLNAEDVSGRRIPDTVIEHHRRAAQLSYSGPFPLPMNRRDMSCASPNTFCPHNVREGFHALYALVRFRDDAWAGETAEESIRCILDLWDPDTGWDITTVEAAGVEWLTTLTFVLGLGRALGPLVKYYRVTRSVNAMRLIHLLRAKLTAEYYTLDGRFDSELFGTHSHSITCCLSSLAQLAELLNDARLLQHVKAFHDNGLGRMRDAIGWSCESTQQPEHRQSDHGEANNTGDILETALILGRFGYATCYADAERILRAHLLPSQLRDVSFMAEPDNPEGLDCLRNMADRHRGAWGFPAPYGHLSIKDGRGCISFNMDIVGGATASLCEALRHIVTRDAFGCSINLLFDYESDDISVKSPYTHDELSISLRAPSAVSIRIPDWADKEAITVSANAGDHYYDAGRLVLPACPAAEEIRISIPLTESTLTLNRNHLQPIRVRLKGDQVTAMDNHGADFTFFDPIPNAG